MNSDGIMGYPDIVGKDAALQNLGEVSNRGCGYRIELE